MNQRTESRVSLQACAPLAPLTDEQIADLRANAGPAPSFFTETTGLACGIEFTYEAAEIVDFEEFIDCFGLPATHATALQRVIDDRRGIFAEAWESAQHEAAREARLERLLGAAL